MTPTNKNIAIGAIVAALSGGGGVYAFDVLLELGDTRWVTIASQNVAEQFDIEDEIAEIQKRIDRGKATDDDVIRKAVLEDRLKRLQLEK